MIKYILINGYITVIPTREENFKKMIIPITENTIIYENLDKDLYKNVNTIISNKKEITGIMCKDKIEEIAKQLNIKLK